MASHSITRRASQPVSITPLGLNMLEQSGVLKRELLPNQSTEFAISRFLTPYLAGYDGWAIFMDNDVVLLDDIKNLWDLRDDNYAVMCVQHDHIPSTTGKFLGEKQTTYEKKNWSSVMLMNCAKCTALTPEYVSKASGLELHRFHWLESDDLIGALPPEWNHLVETSEGKLEDQKVLHYTDGGPYYEAYRDCKWANVWLEERESLLATVETTLLNFNKREPVA
eukprot:CAMPEP_0195254668 /NCGR_PEP_ID=MMETSP0706-20130129/5194_1 /TAXON_ID=33640 /ORGANISM="Asterionellopsis glacialis, Strain CCMP134" /LENGTH=222 /DNA_ID=CAMNT_0040307397 /DNA_START=292 /DNA_END=960 /DNA_ORIENTATION=+